jgi:hypothetical protein
MIQPQSKLPWFADGLYDICALYQDEAVAIELYNEDAEYLVLACNNFPKSIELLKKAMEELQSINSGGLYTTFTHREINKFLEEINE